jgi:Zn-dependent metalloprotease
MANSYRNAPQRPRRKIGCLGRLLILTLILGFLYWLVISPMDLDKSESISQDSPIVDGELSAVQEEALARLDEESGKPLTVLAPAGQVQFLSAKISVPDSIAVDPIYKAQYFLATNSDFFQLEDVEKNLRLGRKTEDNYGYTYIRYSQEYYGVPVYGSSIIVAVNNNEDTIESTNGGYVPNIEVDVSPTIRSIEAENIVVNYIGTDDAELISQTTLFIYAPEIWDVDETQAHLAWFVGATSSKPSSTGLYAVDAHSGEIVGFINIIQELTGEQPSYEIWDAHGTKIIWIRSKLSPKVILVVDQQGQVKVDNPDTEAMDAWNYLIEINDYYLDKYKRNGFDNEGSSIRLFLNATYENDKCITAWLGTNRDKFFQLIAIEKTGEIVVCDGWVSRDVLAHEFTHGVVQSRAIPAVWPFGIKGEARALQEAFADIFAAFIAEDAKDDNPWQLTVGDGNEPYVIRDMMKPTDGYPTHYNDICEKDTEDLCCHKVKDSYDDCGHVNSVIFSHAAYMMSKEKGLSLSQAKLQQVFYHTLTNHLGSAAKFKSTSLVLLESCGKLKDEDEDLQITLADCENIKKTLISAGLMSSSFLGNSRHDAFLEEQSENLIVRPGETFTMKFTLINTGFATWEPDGEYALVLVDGNPMGLPDGLSGYAMSEAIPYYRFINPILEGTAPEQVGSYESTWQMAYRGNDGIEYFGDKVRFKVNVRPGGLQGTIQDWLDPLVASAQQSFEQTRDRLLSDLQQWAQERFEEEVDRLLPEWLQCLLGMGPVAMLGVATVAMRYKRPEVE